MKLTELTSYADAQRFYASERLWELFDGNRERLNLAHECVDRHATSTERVAVRIAYADGRNEHITYSRLKAQSAQVDPGALSRHHANGRVRWLKVLLPLA